MNIETIKHSLPAVPYEVREQVLEVLHTVFKAEDKDGAKINRIEKGLTRYTVQRHTKRANKAVNAALSVIGKGKQDAAVTKAQANKMESAIERAFKGLDKEVKSRWESDTEDVYTINKQRFVKRFKVDPAEKKLVFKTPYKDENGVFRTHKKVIKCKKSNHIVLKQANFGDVDKEIWEQLAAMSVISIGDHFPNELKPAVSKAIQEGVIARGLNKEAAGVFLQKELTKILGATNQAVPASIRLQGVARTNAYFKGLAATNVNFARNFGQLTALDEAEIDKYEIVAVMDNLTSQICAQLNGRVFTLKQGIEHRDKVLAMESVEDLKEYAPWQKDLSSFGLKEGQKLTDNRAAEALAQAGMSMPPYHFRCRTEVHPA